MESAESSRVSNPGVDSYCLFLRRGALLRGPVFIIPLLLFGLAAQVASAADRSWSGTKSTDWNNNSNWSKGGAPGATDNAVFNSTFSNQPSTMATATTVGGIWMTNGVGQNVTVSGTGILTLSGNTINGTAGLGILVDNTNSYTLTITAPLQLGNAQTWRNSSGNLLTIGAGGVDTNGKALTVDGTGNTTISGVVSNSGSVTKAGQGLLALIAANTFTGSTTVSGGTLALAAASGSALGSTSSVTVNSGGTLLLGANNQINDSAPMTLAGGTFAKGNFSEGTTSSVGVGALTLTANSHIDFGTGTVGVLTFANLTVNSFTLTIDNWTGQYGQMGSASTDRLIFDSDQSANLANFYFTGYGAGAVEFALGGGFFEVVAAIPEPSTWVGAAFGLIGIAISYSQWRRRRRSRRVA
jgi:autotransporter-associated beta strand protein